MLGFDVVIHVGHVYSIDRIASIMLLFMCAVRNQILTSHVTK